MNEPLFKIGSVYRDVTHSIVRLTDDREDGFVGSQIWDSRDGRWTSYAARFRLSDGRWNDGLNEWSCMNLAPGELHLVNGSWEPVEDKEEAVFCDALAIDAAADSFANLAMIARDGVAPKVTTVALPTPPLTTAHQSIAGLTVLGAVDHRFGVRVVHGD